MGRCKQYKSPSNIRRSARRLILHLHKIIKNMTSTKSQIDADTNKERMSRDSSGRKIDHTSDTISISDQHVYSPKERSFYTSSPKPLGIVCEECRRNARRLILEDVTWYEEFRRVQATRQAALAALYLLVLSATLWIVFYYLFVCKVFDIIIISYFYNSPTQTHRNYVKGK